MTVKENLDKAIALLRRAALLSDVALMIEYESNRLIQQRRTNDMWRGMLSARGRCCE